MREITITTRVKTGGKKFRELLPVLTSHHLSYKTRGHVRGLFRGFRDTWYLPFYFQGYRILSILLPGIWDTVYNIFVTFRDIGPEYLLWGYLPVYEGYLPIFFQGYGRFGTSLYKPHVYSSCVGSDMLHASETWPLTKTTLQRNDKAMIRQIYSIKPEDVATVRSSKLQAKLELEDLNLILRETRLRWFWACGAFSWCSQNSM